MDYGTSTKHREDETDAPTPPAVEIVIPVYNEALVLADSIRELDGYLNQEFPLSYSITIADNASRDDTPLISRALADDLESVKYLRLEEKGRGRALRAAWTASPSPVACYMDVDLSTDLKALLPLVAPLLSGHSDIAIGSRLAEGSNVVRGPKREFISHGYNRILRTVLRAKFSDAQCGFKAIRTEAVHELLDDVSDQGWFFDTELLVGAQRRGLRVHEVPVDWVDDPDSRVDIMNTAWTDLQGVGRLLAASSIARFALIGLCSTIAYALLFLALRDPVGPGAANAIALALTAVANTAANRRWTFRLRGPERLLRQYAMGLVVYALTLGLTTAAMAVLYGINPSPDRAVEVSVLVLASITATVTRYLALRSWVFDPAARLWSQPEQKR
ncbi:MAG: bifunctional glycosyltransferase family 2/GtrA family protein [Thermoleophilia bacterium]|nr:bifunctional glycosyltransferase family 2/GtrA family protein [Thermoleophilia bacterium]